jgi:hypothetical protein
MIRVDPTVASPSITRLGVSSAWKRGGQGGGGPIMTSPCPVEGGNQPSIYMIKQYHTTCWTRIALGLGASMALQWRLRQEFSFLKHSFHRVKFFSQYLFEQVL